MSRFGSKEEILKAIENYFILMQQGKLTLDELEMLVEQSRELYERTLILRHKAYEEKVFGETKEYDSGIVPEKTEPEVNSENEIDLFNTNETVFDFDVFDEDKLTSTTEIDGSNQKALQMNLEEENIQLSNNKMDNPFNDKNSHEQEESSDYFLFEANRDSTLEKTTSTSNQNIFDKILKVDNPLGLHLTLNKLDTLTGSYGFNEKFQYIQELFKGSSEDFNQAIETLDNLRSFDEAKHQLEYYVHLHKWDLESDIVSEFVKKVERRYK